MRSTALQGMLNEARRLIARARVARLPVVLRQYAVDGNEPPGSLARAFIATMQAFDSMVDGSIGGENFDEASPAYEARLRELEMAKRNPTAEIPA